MGLVQAERRRRAHPRHRLQAIACLATMLLAVAVALFAWDEAGATPSVVTAGPFTLTFYNNGDSDGSTSGVQNWTAQQMDDAAAGVAAWSGTIYNAPGRQINLHMFWGEFGNNSTLGASSNVNNGNGTTSWTYAERVWRDGVNYTGPFQGYDASIQYDVTAAGVSGGWNFGAATPGSTQIDFRSVVTHEIGHTLGFYDTYIGNGRRGTWGNCWGTAAGPDNWAGYLGLALWDQNLKDSSGDRPANGQNGTPGRLNVTDNPVYWTGAYAMAAYGGNVPIYAPSQYSSGSSLSHLDETALPNALMSPFVDLGQVVRQPTALEWEMMKDMGWIVIKRWGQGAGTLAWSDAGNWNLAGVPDKMNHALFTSAGLADNDVITLGGDRTIDSMGIDSTASFTIDGTAGTLTLNRGILVRSAASSGIQTVARPIALGAGGVWTIDGAGQFAVSGAITGGGFGLTKTGAGVLVLINTGNSFSGPVAVSAGVISVASSGNLGNGASSNSLQFGGGTLQATDSFSTSRSVTVGAGGGTLEVADTKEVTLTGNFGIVSGGATVTKQGAGALTVAGPQAHASAAGLIVNAGTLNVNTDAGDSSHYNLSVTAASTSVVNFGATQHLAALTLNNTVVATLTQGGTKTLVTKTLSIASATAKLDLTDNNLIVDYADGAASPYEQVRDYVKVGRGTKDIFGTYLWNGLGITSSVAQAAYQTTALGVLDNSYLPAGFRKTDLEGVPVDDSTVMVKYTYYGDANLDGKVDRNDLIILVNNFLVTQTPLLVGWQTADFNYDGVVDRDDLNLFLVGWRNPGAPLGGVTSLDGLTPADLQALLADGALNGIAGAVPEPGTLALLGLAATAVAARRRRSG